ncbi:RICIN domain-containing protein [Streptomyces rhizosphaerihabitans]|uniref:RICIN domain-containing protein n=1 Tax=Streptomyces rhizosphaerihabitans TaxID=1266770 RepID=UPI0028F6D440|nr:RICIN domain-containing protein [Streptomyces rhizosphaerihabitans]
MKRSWARKVFATATAFGTGVAFAIASATNASAYQPSPATLYTAGNTAACNKSPCVLYPKSAQLPDGRIVATFENDQTAPVGQTLPVYKSDDEGTTWAKLTDVKAPAYLSGDSAYAKYTSNWTNPYLYVLPQNVGNLSAGTLLLASIVSGDDSYYQERKAADSGWTPTSDGDRKDVALALYASTDDGATWSFENIIAAGGWQGGSAGSVGRVSTANTHAQVDPVWEPHLLAHNGTLIAYYSDEDDYTGYDSGTGAPILDPANDTATDSGGQVLLHRTWNGSTATSWSGPVVDVPGATVSMGSGRTEIGGGRPGMTTIAPTTDGKWLLTYEYWGGGTNVRYRISDDPTKFFSATDSPVTSLPVPSGGSTPATGGSPVLLPMPDGRIVYNAAGSGDVWVNESGLSTGTWKEYRTPIAAGYSRHLQYVDGTGRVLILQASWSGGSVGPVKYAEVDLGRSDGAYYSLVNRLTGQVLATASGRTQDASLTGNTPDLVLSAGSTADTQRWHLGAKGGNVTLLNKAGGRSVAVWTGTATAGQKLAQWVDDGATDKQWTLVSSTSGYYKLRSVLNTSLYMTGSTTGGSVTVAASATDGSQDWQLVQDPLPTDSAFTLKGTYSGRCLDVPNGRTGVQVQIYDCSGNADQTITRTAAGELRVLGNCLAADGDGTTAGTKLILWACNGKSGQKWSFRVDGTIGNRSDGLAIDVTGWGTANGSKVELWTPLGNATQQWSRG